jgi:hypothetical protein
MEPKQFAKRRRIAVKERRDLSSHREHEGEEIEACMRPCAMH